MRDDEYPDGARVTLESDVPFKTPPWAITCGIYGWMVHTRWFSGEEDAQVAFAELRDGLARILSLIPYKDDPALEAGIDSVIAAISEFIDRFP